ncbi:MAG: class I SAM-dependent methyltransferase [Solirubrobacterales bacterium]
MSELPEHVSRNRAQWDQWAADFEGPGLRNWAADEPTWGIWDVPESELGVLPDALDGLDAIELGCGTGYVSSWLARRGARPVGIDNSEAQLASARRFQEQFGIEFPLIHGNAEDVPLPDASFDLAISEYGASIWCDPYRWIPEAARLLRPGGELVFMVNSVLVMLCTPDIEEGQAGNRLLRPQFGMNRFEWSDDESVEFHLSHGELIALLRDSGFAIEQLIEVRAPEGGKATFPLTTLEWSRNWPCEEVWRARRR